MQNNGWCVVGCPTGWIDCGAGCAVSQGECDNKIKFNQTSDIGSTAGFVASAISGAGRTKRDSNMDKVTALYVGTDTSFKTRVDAYAQLIKSATLTRNGSTLTDDQALDLAKQAVAAVMTGMEARGKDTSKWDETMTYVEQIDPTGVLGSAKTFEQDSCAVIQL